MGDLKRVLENTSVLLVLLLSAPLAALLFAVFLIFLIVTVSVRQSVTAAARTAMSTGSACSQASSIWRADSTLTTSTPDGSGWWLGPDTRVVCEPSRARAPAMAGPCLPEVRLAR